MTHNDIVEYKHTYGARAAADLLLLHGPDGFDGDYDSLMTELENEASSCKMYNDNNNSNSMDV